MDDRLTYLPLTKYILILNKKDNVGVAFKDIPVGRYKLKYDKNESLVTITEEIKAGFKLSLRRIAKNDLIYKYGHPIGAACKDIKTGENVHIHNMRSLINYPEKTQS